MWTGRRAKGKRVMRCGGSGTTASHNVSESPDDSTSARDIYGMRMVWSTGYGGRAGKKKKRRVGMWAVTNRC